MNELKDKVAVVTGAGGGIGAATALAFAREGAAGVVIADMNGDAAAAAAEAVRREGRCRAEAVTTDVSDPASIERLGVKITPQRVAATVWKAVHGDRVHWRVGFDARMINFAARLLGAGVAPLYRRIMDR